MDNKKEKTIFFNINEIKKFSFTQEQYMNLEIEYNRFIIYNALIKNIEIILNIHETFDYNKKKKYENKNIIERFVLECINHGISPNISHNEIDLIEDKNIIDNDNINIRLDKHINDVNISHNDVNISHNDVNDINDIHLYKHIFFNPILSNSVSNYTTLSNIYYFKKMISEYNEKKIKLSPDIISNIIKEFIKAETQFIKVNNDFNKMIKNTIVNINKQVECNIKLDNNNFIIKYRDYIKIIDANRYYKLMKNYERPFPYDMIRMILRYSIFDTSSQQWSIGIDLYENISELFDISFETFASPLNFNMYRFCSLFYDTDNLFGSVGSFYNLNCENLLLQNIKGVFFNPPYLPILMKKCSLQCLKLLNEIFTN